MCIAIVCYPGCDVMDCEINLIFLIEPFFLHDQKVMTKTWIPWERKELLRWNKKSISHHFLRAIIEANIFFFLGGGGGGECPTLRKQTAKDGFYEIIS